MHHRSDHLHVVPLQLVESVGVEPLMEACEGEGPELQAVSMQCIAALTMHDALKAPVLDAEGLAVIGAAARSPSAGVQRPAAAALANLCGDASLLPRVAASPDGIPSLLTLSQSADRIAQVSPCPAERLHVYRSARLMAHNP